MLNLINAISAEGIAVDVLLNRTDIPELSRISPSVRMVSLGNGGLLRRVRPLADYLIREKPAALITNHKERAIRDVVLAKKFSGSSVPIVFRIGTTLSNVLAWRSFWKRWLLRRSIRFFYPRANTIIANSKGVAVDVAQITGLPLASIPVINNSTVSAEQFEKALEPVDHPWFRGDAPPVILAVGRLRKVKDFPTLIRAFAKLQQQRDCRLMILGEGKERRGLEKLTAELGISDKVSMPGFVSNPYAYMKRSTLLVLSSAWEGSPNVLIEALSLGVPVVATDCHSGPRDILQDGKFGSLVPVGDVDALADGMLQTLQAPADSDFLKRAAEPFWADRVAREYLDAAGL